MSEWTKRSYGDTGTGHWTISDGKLQFDVHPLRVCGIEKSYDAVTDAEADQYADAILDALNICNVRISP